MPEETVEDGTRCLTDEKSLYSDESISLGIGYDDNRKYS